MVHRKLHITASSIKYNSLNEGQKVLSYLAWETFMKASLKIKNNLVTTVNKVLNDEVLVELGNSFKVV